MSNSFSFPGRLGRDAELKEVNNHPLLEFNVANEVGFGDKKVTNWIKCGLWGKQAKSLEPYLIKGRQVYINGELTLRSYINKNQEKRLSPELRVLSVDLIGNKDDNPNTQPTTSNPPSSSQNDEEEDDMPF